MLADVEAAGQGQWDPDLEKFSSLGLDGTFR